MCLDIDRVSSLTGSKEDVNSIHYQRLKTQLTQMRQARHECRFLYLIGQHAIDLKLNLATASVMNVLRRFGVIIWMMKNDNYCCLRAIV
jgi:hypothetical protein